MKKKIIFLQKRLKIPIQGGDWSMTKITTWEYFKKRWLYYVSLIFIFLIPLAMIIEKFIRMEPVKKYAEFSLTGFILGVIYIAFLSKKIKKKLEEMKYGVLKIFLTGISNIIPFLTVGFLIVLVESTLKGFNITVFAICISMFIGTIIQIIEFIINRQFLYNQKIEELAREQVDIELKKKELLAEYERMIK